MVLQKREAKGEYRKSNKTLLCGKDQVKRWSMGGAGATGLYAVKK